VQRVIKAVEPHDSAARYTALGVECIQGEARIASPWTAEISTASGTRTLSTRAIVIAAGARPFVPPIPGMDAIRVLTSDNVWDLRELPRRLLVLGGGPVGRVANTAGYGLEELGIPVSRARTVETNEWLQTLYPNIYTCGDVAGPYQFTHTASHQAWYAAVNALFGSFRKFRADYSAIPWA